MGAALSRSNDSGYWVGLPVGYLTEIERIGHRAEGTGLSTEGTGHRAEGTGLRAEGMANRQQGTSNKGQGRRNREQGTGNRLRCPMSENPEMGHLPGGTKEEPSRF
jgi:hypothetical protein